MPDHEDSLGGETFSGEEQQDLSNHSLGDGANMSGDTAAHSLGDQSTFGDTDVDDELFDDGIELVDLSTRYTEEGVLGKGGMGEVILATDTRLGRKVAIKRILGKAARSKTAVARFLTEAKSIAAISHNNIVQIHDYGRSAVGPFLIMECVQGGSLLDKCKAGPIELDEAVNIFVQLCDGLAKAHAAGIIHRDIKPANVLMTEDGIPKLTDFGLAKDDTADTGMTMEGAVIGTLDFMPPEQRQAAALTDHRSDLWSLAATFYQMLTGKSPKVINIAALPAKLQSVVAKALEESKEDRFQSAMEMRETILQAHSGKIYTSRSLGEGECPECATPNPSGNKYCDECGSSLQVKCLNCESDIAIWNKACRECGTQQDLLVKDALKALQTKHDEAERFLNELKFDDALKSVSEIGEQDDPRLLQFATWHEDFSIRLESSRTSEYTRLEELLREAHAHEQAYDYEAGLQTLTQVAPSLKNTTVVGSKDTAEELTNRLVTKQSRPKELEGIVRERITKRVNKPAIFFVAIMLLCAGVLVLFKAGRWLDAADPNNQSEEKKIADFVPEIKPADYELGEGEPWITDFQLVDQAGGGFESKALRDKVWVASFFFASCPSTCVQQNQEMQSLHKVWARKGVKFISISCDADNDTPAVLNSYAKKFTSDNENWKFLTGNSQYINRIGSDKFLLSVGPQTHAESFCAVDKWGNVRGAFNWHDVEAMEELNKLLVALLLEEEEPVDVVADRERLEKQIAEFVKQQQTDTVTEPSRDE